MIGPRLRLYEDIDGLALNRYCQPPDEVIVYKLEVVARDKGKRISQFGMKGGRRVFKHSTLEVFFLLNSGVDREYKVE